MAYENLQQNIKGLLEKFGFGERDVVVTHDEGSNIVWFSVSSPSTRLLLAKDAEALTALNYVATKIAEQLLRTEENRPRVIVDANGFEKKKIENLKTIAHMMAERARYFKSSVAVEPMPPHERRIIHEHLANDPDLETESAGEGAARHVIIRYKNPAI